MSDKPYICTPTDLFLGTVPADRELLVVPSLKPFIEEHLRGDGLKDIYAHNALLRRLKRERQNG